MPQKHALSIDGHREIISAFRNADTELNRLGRGYLKNLSDYGVNQSHKHLLSAGAVDTMLLLDSISYDIQQRSRGINSTIQPKGKAAKYAAPVETGSKPHWPPIAALEGWAQRHGIPAYLVARKIALEGTEPTHFWINTFEDLDDEVQNTLDDFSQDILNKL